jgi:hypothetical protein
MLSAREFGRSPKGEWQWETTRLCGMEQTTAAIRSEQAFITVVS